MSRYLSVDKRIRNHFPEELYSEFENWCRKLNLSITLLVDNRLTGMDADALTNTIRINYKLYEDDDYRYAMHSLLHELFHIKMNHWGTDEQQEYSAENFAIKIMNKFYHEVYDRIVDETCYCIYSGDWKRKHPIHTKAFSRIDDYRI